jgi:Polyketide cyclase / dehydrase and lipid transport
MPENDEKSSDGSSLLDQLPTDRLREVGQTLFKTASDKAIEAALGQVEGLADRLTGVADNGGTGLKAALGGGEAAAEGGNPVMGAIKGGMSAATDKVKGALGMGGGESGGAGSGGSGGGSGKFKFMNIVEELDVGVPIRVAYDQWTLFADFPTFMKKVHTVDQESDEKTNWYAQVFLSKRTWEATIIEQIPDTHIIWRSTGAKGYVNGIVSFHELAPSLTKVLLVLEYYPVGFFEKTANIWRAVGRRARLEFKHYRRHVMVHTLVDKDELEGWRGEIRDSEVVETHEEAMEREEAERAESDEDTGAEDSYDEGDYDDEDYDGEEYDDADEDFEPAAEDEEYDEESDEDEPFEESDEYDEDEPVDEESDEDVVDEVSDEDEADEDEQEPEPDEGRRAGSRRRARAGSRG